MSSGRGPDPGPALDLLWQPASIGAVRLRNRVFVSAHTTNFGTANTPTARHVAYHAERAAGGVGLIITEAVRVHPTSAARDSSLGAFSDAVVPAYAAVVDAVHAEGAAMFAQLLHLGRQAAGDTTRTAAWGPSPLPWSVGSHLPHAMTGAEIDVVVEAFAAAAGRMVRAGFDGLEVHLGHGHLVQQFLSPVSNRRTDDYGGSLDNRMRLARRVLAAVFARVPTALPVGIRISAEEFLPGGLGLDDMLEVVERLREQFPLAFVHVSHSAYVGDFSLSTQMADMSHPSAPFRHLPAAVKAAFPDLPVLAICRIDDVATAAALLAEGTADLVGMTRAHIADPHLLAKVRDGRADEVRSCLACNQGCIGRIEKNVAMSCVVNPEVGFEAQWRAWRAAQTGQSHRPGRPVLVIGGGPAGLEAALTARRLGHEVHLVEAEQQLGGQVHDAAGLSGRERLGLLVREQARDAARLGVHIELGRHADAAVVGEADWVAVIVATGATQQVTPVPGVTTIGPREVLTGAWVLGETVAVLDETGDWSGAAVTEHLARAGHRVVLLTPVAGVAWNITVYSRLGLLRRLGDLGVQVRPLRRPVRGEGGDLVITDTLTGREERIPGVSTLVHIGPPAARDALFEAITAARPALPARLVGDALAPRSALEAVYEGRLATAQLLTDGPNLDAGYSAAVAGSTTAGAAGSVAGGVASSTATGDTR